MKTVLLFYTGLLPFVPIFESFLEIPLPLALRSLSHTRTHTLLLWLLDVTCMNRLLFFHLRRRGIHVILWVLNDDASFRRAASLGATGVMTGETLAYF